MLTTQQRNPIWLNVFEEPARKQQMADDSSAWRIVTGILLTIVTVGVLLAFISVWICT